MSTTDINLLKRDARSIQDVSILEQRLQLVAWWSLVSLLASGIIIGTSFAILKVKTEQARIYNNQLRKQIDAQISKEAFIQTVKERTLVVGKTLSAGRLWGNLFPILVQIASQDKIKTLTIDEVGKVNIHLVLFSVEDAITIINNAISLVNSSTIKAPQLISFALREDGSIQMAVSFIPNL